MCVYMIVLHISSPYLLVFGDDRVRGTREQMMLQVDLVMRRVGVELAWEKNIFIRVFMFYDFRIIL